MGKNNKYFLNTIRRQSNHAGLLVFPDDSSWQSSRALSLSAFPLWVGLDNPDSINCADRDECHGKIFWRDKDSTSFDAGAYTSANAQFVVRDKL